MISQINWQKLPENCGVYIFKDQQGKVLYIGKAKNIRKRIKQHYQTKSPKIIKLLNESCDLEYLVTKNEFEAFLKESALIKKFNPVYNQLLKDDSKYFYVIFTDDLYPKILIVHQPEKWRYSSIFGPFIDGSSLRALLKLIRTEIPFCTCLNQHQRQCLNASLGLCLGFCCFGKTKEINKNNKKLYFFYLKMIKNVLNGRLEFLKKKILKEIDLKLKVNDLEKAYQLKKIYLSLKKIENNINFIKDADSLLAEHQNYKILLKIKNVLGITNFPRHIEVVDVSHFAGKDTVAAFVTFIDGFYKSNLLRKFKINLTKVYDALSIYYVVLRRLAHKEWGYPDLILIDGGIDQLNKARQAVNEKNLMDRLQVISLAKPKEIIYFYKDNHLQSLLLKDNVDLRNFFILLDKKAHNLALKYHRSLREKLITNL
ncbi:MAG: UvrABC system protein C [Candidatus Parcubacteria bacterium]|nr:MAG: UvrABC system protein C [Candidatus Parcubacteria bacterium]